MEGQGKASTRASAAVLALSNRLSLTLYRINIKISECSFLCTVGVWSSDSRPRPTMFKLPPSYFGKGSGESLAQGHHCPKRKAGGAGRALVTRCYQLPPAAEPHTSR